MAGGGGEEGECSVDIDSVVIEGDLARLAHGFQRSEVDDTVNVWVFGEDLVEGLLVCDVDIVVLWLLSADQLNAVEDFGG